MLKKIDQAVAKGEAAIAALLLLLMIFVAAFQALFRNLSDWGFSFANNVLVFLEWGDPFLQKGTLLLAFLGASLATYDDKHIGIDVLQRIAPTKIRQTLRILISFGAGFTSFLLAYVFWLSIVNITKDIPMLYSVISDGETLHVCDASLETLQSAEIERPSAFCAVRAFTGLLGAPASTPGFAIQTFLPLMFGIIGVRFIARAIQTTINFIQGKSIEDQQASSGETDSNNPIHGEVL